MVPLEKYSKCLKWTKTNSTCLSEYSKGDLPSFLEPSMTVMLKSEKDTDEKEKD